MKPVIVCILFTICVSLATGCGPREIGQDIGTDVPIRTEATGADIMRLPMTGMTNTQRMLYWHNRPDVMERMQQWRLDLARRHMGISPEDPAYREVPKQRSPFRQ